MATQMDKTTPEIHSQTIPVDAMALHATTHRHPLQRPTRCSQRVDHLRKGIDPSWRGVNFNGIGPFLLQKSRHRSDWQPMLTLSNQSKRASRQTTPTAVTTLLIHTGVLRDGIGRTDPGAGPWAIRWAAFRVKPCFAEMRIDSITEAHHQPGAVLEPSFSPIETESRRPDHGGIGGNIDTVHTCSGVHSRQISDRGQILIARSADQLDPAALMQSLVRRQPCSRSVIDCHFRVLEPPISTMIFRRGSRRQRSQSD